MKQESSTANGITLFSRGRKRPIYFGETPNPTLPPMTASFSLGRVGVGATQVGIVDATAEHKIVTNNVARNFRWG